MESEEKQDKSLEVFKSFDIKKCDALMKSKKGLKNKKKLEAFVSKMNMLLSSIQKDELKKYDVNVVKFVCETIEHILVERNSGDLKKAIAIEVLKPYFDDNEDLVSKFIELVIDSIVKSTCFTRTRNCICNFFCLCIV